MVVIAEDIQTITGYIFTFLTKSALLFFIFFLRFWGYQFLTKTFAKRAA